MVMPALRVEDLGVRYGALVALDGVSWEVAPGEVLGIIGPNGAGKSTCYDASTNLVSHGGRVFLDGKDVTSLPPYRLASRGLRRAFQQNAFFGDLTVLENMINVLRDDYGNKLMSAVFLPARTSARHRAAVQQAGACLERFGIDRSLHMLKPTDISYGTQRMLSIALAYGNRPRVLMLDEPAAGLGGADMNRLIDTLHLLKAESIAMVIIEHHMDLIMSVADHIVVLDQGRVLANGTPDEIRANPRVLEAYLGREE